jgi:type VI secretion system secreted protein Hcp
VRTPRQHISVNGSNIMAVVDYFLKVDGIEGESTDDKHKNEIDVESWSWGETQGGTHAGGGGGGAGKVSMQDFNFVMKVNKASPKLLLACATGEHIKKAVLTCRKAGGKQEEYLLVTFSDLLCSSFQTGGSTGDVVPVDQISLNFSKIEIEYKPQTEKGALGGPVKVGYDLKLNKKV